MVSDDGRNNIIYLAVIAAFSVLVISFILTFVANMERATNVVTVEVSKGVDNVTLSQAILTKAVVNMTDVVNDELALMKMEDARDKQNLDLFFSAFRNQTNEIVNVVNEMSRDNNVTREKQTTAFIEGINALINASEATHNLTKVGQNLTEVRTQALTNNTESMQELIKAVNLTLSLGNTTVANN